MKDDRTEKLIRDLRRNHPAAIKALLDAQGTRRNDLVQLVSSMIKADQRLVLDAVTPDSRRADWDGMVKFAPKAWDKWNLGRNVKWTSSNRLIMFEIFVGPNYGVHLWLIVGPGDDRLRPALIDGAAAKGAPFNANYNAGGWHCTYEPSPWVLPEDYGSTEWEPLVERVRSEFEAFVEDELPELIHAVKECHD